MEYILSRWFQCRRDRGIRQSGPKISHSRHAAKEPPQAIGVSPGVLLSRSRTTSLPPPRLTRGARERVTNTGRHCPALSRDHDGTTAKKIGLAIQLSQGQDRQPLSPEGAHPPAVRA